MPTKLLNTKPPAKQLKTKAAAKPAQKVAAPKVKRGGDPWLRDTRREETTEEQRGGKNWLPKEKSRDWLRNRG